MSEPAPRSGALGNWLTGALILALVLGAVVMGVDELHGGLPEASAAPAFSFEKFGGGRVSSEALAGKVVMLDFWATWCPPCVEEMPWLVKLAKEFEARGVAFVAVSRDDPDEAKAAVGIFIADRVPELEPYAVFSGPEDGARFKVRALPTIYVLDRQGKIVGSRTGLSSEGAVRRMVEEALAR